MYKYLHDSSARTVYKFPAEPWVTERSQSGKRAGWHVTMECIITRADNWLANGRWAHGTSSNPVHHLDAHYTREQALSYFRMHHEPKGVEIDRDEYERLHGEYEREAKTRRPGAVA